MRSVQEILSDSHVSTERGESKNNYWCTFCGLPYNSLERALECEKQGSESFLFDVGDEILVKDIEEAGWYRGKTVKIIGKLRYIGTHENEFVTERMDKNTYLQEKFIERKIS